jgi:thiol-disulfide isomerase/thioredoxin
MTLQRRVPTCHCARKVAKKSLAPCFFLFIFCFLLSSCRSSLVRPINEAKLQKLVTNLPGKVVLVNFWATWCEPCVEEFPDLMKLAREYRPRGLEIIFVSIDDPEEINAKVLPFLQAQNVSFQTYIKQAKDDEAFINAIDPNWSGAIPATFIYDANGMLVKRLVAQQNYETFAEAVQPLLMVSQNTK